MATFSSLPAELVLKIARSMRSHDSPKHRARTLAALYEEEEMTKRPIINLRLQKYHLRAEQTSLLSLASTCHTFRSIVAPEAYYFISNVVMKGSWPPLQLFTMLQLLEQRPDIRGWIRQLHLDMQPSTYLFDDLTPGQIQSLWEQVESKYGVKISGREENRHGASRSTDEMGYGILLAVLLSVLPGVQGLSAFSTAATFAHAGDYFVQHPALLTRANHQGRNDCVQEMSSTTILPNLTSLAVINPVFADIVNVDLQQDIARWSPMAILDVCPNLSKVWADGFYNSPPLGNLPQDACQNITALNLLNTLISADDFSGLMKRIQCLEIFKFLVMKPNCGDKLDNDEFELLSPRAAARGLECHARSLRTFCYRNNGIPFDPDELFDTFEAFTILENLWIDTRGFETGMIGGYGLPWIPIYSASEDESNMKKDHGLKNLPGLPGSLRRLYISGHIEPIFEGLRALASVCELRFPKLEKVVFGPSGWAVGRAIEIMGMDIDGPDIFEMDTDTKSTEEIYKLFSDAGVEAHPEALNGLNIW